MDVAIFISSMEGGGAERVVSHLATHWTRENRKVGVITISATGADAYPLPASVCRIGLGLNSDSTGIASAIYHNVQRVLRLRRVLKSARPPVVLGFLSESNVTLILAALGLGLRIVVSERNFPPSERIARTWRMLRRRVYALADVVVAQTDECAQWLDENTTARHIEVIPNGVVWPLPDALPHRAPDELLKPDETLVLAVGRLDPQKGFDLLLDAFAPIARDFPGWKLVIVGKGTDSDTSYVAQLEARIAQPDLCAAVQLAGRVGNLADWYARCELFVLSSRYEGFPNALLEAMAAGCAVLSTRCPAGPADIVESGVNGLLVDDIDAAHLHAGMQRLITDAALRSRLGEAATEVRVVFSAERIMALWSQVLQLSTPADRPAGPADTHSELKLL